MTQIAEEVARGLGLPIWEVCHRLRGTRQGKNTHFSTVFRWLVKGVTLPSGDVVRLEGVRLGGRWLTSEPALQRFLVAQTPEGHPEQPQAVRHRSRKRRGGERAGEQLEAMGI